MALQLAAARPFVRQHFPCPPERVKIDLLHTAMVGGTRTMMHGEYKMPGGKLVVVDLEVRDGRLAGVRVSGDFFLEPDSALDTINQVLDGQPHDADETTLAAAIAHALDSDVMMYGLSSQAIATAVRRAVDGGTAS